MGDKMDLSLDELMGANNGSRRGLLTAWLHVLSLSCYLCRVVVVVVVVVVFVVVFVVVVFGFGFGFGGWGWGLGVRG